MNPARRTAHRFIDILEAIGDIRHILDGRTLEQLRADRLRRPAVERCFEIISEASRHVPDEVKSASGEIPWKKVAGLGNILRHAYQDTNPAILWDIYENHLSDLEQASARPNPTTPTLTTTEALRRSDRASS